MVYFRRFRVAIKCFLVVTVTTSTRSLSVPHELVRQHVKQVVCLICDTEQEAARDCSKCGVTHYGRISLLRSFRVGGRENFFHCGKCGSCYATSLRNNHECVENSMKNYCPICYEYLFDSVKGSQILKCGHTMHIDCLVEMAKQHQYRCPICSKSVFDMSTRWEILTAEIEATEMPQEYRYEEMFFFNSCFRLSRLGYHWRPGVDVCGEEF